MACDLWFGIAGIQYEFRNLWLGICDLASLVWDGWLEIFGLESLLGDLWFGIFDLRSLVWDHWFELLALGSLVDGISGLGSLVWCFSLKALV